MTPYKAIVVLVPQDVTLEEWQSVGAYAYDFRHDMTASHHTMLSILKTSGDPTSYVKVAFPQRQRDRIELIEAAGYGWVPITVDPLAGLRLGHLFGVRYVLTDPFNSPRSYANHLHEGVDFDVMGGPPDNKVGVLCAWPGVVQSVSWDPSGYGKYVRVECVWQNYLFHTWYCHLDAQYVVKGQMVEMGQGIGEVGSTGYVDGEHLHFTLDVPGYGLSGYSVADVVDPLPYLPPKAEREALPRVPLETL